MGSGHAGPPAPVESLVGAGVGDQLKDPIAVNVIGMPILARELFHACHGLFWTWAGAAVTQMLIIRRPLCYIGTHADGYLGAFGFVMTMTEFALGR